MQWLCLVLTTEAARLTARQKDSAGVAGDLLSVPGVKIRGQPVRGPGVGFPSSDFSLTRLYSRLWSAILRNSLITAIIRLVKLALLKCFPGMY